MSSNTPGNPAEPTATGVPALLAAALAAHQAGQLDAAETYYHRILTDDPTHPAVLANLGMLHHQRHAADKAMEWYERALAARRTPEVLSNLAMLRRAQGDADGAIRLLTEALTQRPGFSDALHNLGMTLIDAGRPAEAIGPLKQRLRDTPTDPEVHANLTRALDAVGRRSEALEHGRQTLLLKDQQACAAFQASGARPLAPAPVPAFDPSQPHRNIIAISLWGTRPTYVEGAIANAGLTPLLYHGWTCRIYADESVPAHALAALKREGAQVVMMPPPTAHYGLFWRFLAADDPDVDYFLCRDADARLNTQEVAAVTAWLRSGRAFHIMRDAPFHTELMLAGLWGGVGRRLRGIRNGIDQFYRPTDHRWVDQDFLRREIWPRIRAQVLIHDSCYDLFGAVPFPTEGRLAGGQHVGAGYIVADTGEIGPSAP